MNVNTIENSVKEYSLWKIMSYVSHILLEYPLLLSEPNYKELLIGHLRRIYFFDVELESKIQGLDQELEALGKCRSGPSTMYPSIVPEGHLEALRNKPQPEQRTDAWYVFRHDHITASNGWKALGTVASQNQLIYEKCQPLSTEKFAPSLTETPMSWGQKYEYLTTCLYEEKNQTTISSFGCIEHPQYPFLAASPDGIVTGDNNYGRMIEIKNVVSREINGNPKKDYYIQMQLQMEVCDLDECDFVETKFIEYDTEEAFQKDDAKKGVIMVFLEEGEYVYRYMPLSTLDYNTWMNETYEQTQLTWVKNLYWKLDVYSCILVKRQREWFQAAVPAFVSIWETILRERENGEYVKRAPKKRAKPTPKQEICQIKNEMFQKDELSDPTLDPTLEPMEYETNEKEKELKLIDL